MCTISGQGCKNSVRKKIWEEEKNRERQGKRERLKNSKQTLLLRVTTVIQRMNWIERKQ